MTTGYAIKQGGCINVATISSTERAAIVNWLVVECKLLITNSARDDQIQHAWEHLSQERGATCIKVKIEEIST